MPPAIIYIKGTSIVEGVRYPRHLGVNRQHVVLCFIMIDQNRLHELQHREWKDPYLATLRIDENTNSIHLNSHGNWRICKLSDSISNPTTPPIQSKLECYFYLAYYKVDYVPHKQAAAILHLPQ